MRTASNTPRARYDPADPTPTAYTRPTARDPFADDGPGPNDVTAAIYLLLRTQDLTSEVFICPTDRYATKLEFGAGKTSLDGSNFPGRRNLSYAMANPYPSPAAVEAGWRWDNAIGAEYALLGDAAMLAADGALSPATESSWSDEMRAANSPNHDIDGQNVLYADGHVEFQQTAFCGARKDDIYTAGGPADAKRLSPAVDAPAPTPTPAGVRLANGTPVGPLDSVLLPASPAGMAPLVLTGDRLAFTLLGVVALAVVLGVAAFVLNRRRSAGPAV